MVRYSLVLALGLQPVVSQLCGIQADCSSCVSTSGCIWNANACWSSSTYPSCGSDPNCYALVSSCPASYSASVVYPQPIATSVYANAALYPSVSTTSVGTVLPPVSVATSYPVSASVAYPATTVATSYPITTSFAASLPAVSANIYAKPSVAPTVISSPLYSSFGTSLLPSATVSTYGTSILPSVSANLATPIYSSLSTPVYTSPALSASLATPIYSTLPSASYYASPTISATSYPVYTGLTSTVGVNGYPVYSNLGVNANVGLNGLPVYSNLGVNANVGLNGGYYVNGQVDANGRLINNNNNGGIFGNNGLFSSNGNPIDTSIRNNFYASALDPIIPGIGGAVSAYNNANILANSPQFIDNVVSGNGYRRDPFGTYVRNNLYANALGSVAPGISGSLGAFNQLNLYSSLLG